MNWYLKALRQYADFSGRARRKEYWLFSLFNLLFLIVAGVADNLLGLTILYLPYGAFYFLYAFAVFVPGLAVVVRRLHDIGKSGWMILISLIPIVGTIWLLVLLCTDSEEGDNEYGSCPKQGENIEPISNTNADMAMFILVIWLLVTRVFYFVTPKLVDDFFNTLTFQIVSGIMGFIWALIPICIGIVIADKTKKTIVFVLGAIYLLLSLYETFSQYLMPWW